MSGVEEQALLEAAAGAARHAHAPYSNYRVGAAVRTADGRVFTGCNVENASYGLTLCAERAAVAAAVVAGSPAITAVAVAALGDARPLPCGACRQVLAEFCAPDCPVTCARAPALDDRETHRLGDLLPHAFVLTPPPAPGAPT